MLSPTHLAARIPETLVGCRFNGIDVEHWVGEQLIDFSSETCPRKRRCRC